MRSKTYLTLRALHTLRARNTRTLRTLNALSSLYALHASNACALHTLHTLRACYRRRNALETLRTLWAYDGNTLWPLCADNALRALCARVALRTLRALRTRHSVPTSPLRALHASRAAHRLDDDDVLYRLPLNEGNVGHVSPIIR